MFINTLSNDCFVTYSLWLNEGFASYMESDCLSHVEPNTGVLDRFVIEYLPG